MKKVILILGALLGFLGTIGTVTPMCIGFFYSPKKPAALK